MRKNISTISNKQMIARPKIPIPWLDPHDLTFPPLASALDEPNGLLAAGGDLSAARLIQAYRRGIFPWYEDPQPILWWSPDPRCVLLPGNVHISKSLRKTLRSQRFRITCDTAFTDVVRACAAPRSYSSDTWISAEMLRAYADMHRLGVAHSIEVWQQNRLVGGLYGVALGEVFFGESMFSLASNASKIALVYLSGQLQTWGYQLIDCQVTNEHLLSLGATEMPREEFEERLRGCVDAAGQASPWAISWQP